MRQDDVASAAVDAVSKPQRGRSTPVAGSDQPENRNKRMCQCRRCGKRHGPRECPAYGKKCGRCNSFGHFQSCCKTNIDAVEFNSEKEVKEVGMHEDGVYYDLPIITIDSVEGTAADWIMPIKLNSIITVTPMKLNTWAQANVISEDDLKKLAIKPKISLTKGLKGYFGHKLPVKWKCILKAEHNGMSFHLAFFVVPGRSSPILGKNACEKMGLIRLVCSVKYGLIEEYDQVFRGLGCLPGELTFRLTKKYLKLFMLVGKFHLQ